MLELESDTDYDGASAARRRRTTTAASATTSISARIGRLARRCLDVISLFRSEQIERLIFEDSPPSPVIRQSNAMKTGQRWLLVFILFMSVIVLIVLMNSVSVRHGSLTITLDLDELTERGKCPACFGVHLCPQMVSGKIELNDWTKYSVSKLVNSKNIFYATWKTRGGDRKLILKKLAHDDELTKLDKEICDRHEMEDECDVKSSVRFLIDKYAHTTANRPDEPILHGEKIGKITDILLCPSHNKMDYMISAVTKISKGPHRSTILAHILTMLLLNPEPLILQTFRSEDGWPFPVYYGACGRIVAEEYVGRRLTSFYSEDFRTRALISHQLLQIAFQLSDASNYTLYLGDVSSDNFAVNEDEDYKVKVIDLENVIVVDKLQFSHGESKKVHAVESARCENKHSGNSEGECFTVSTDDLCTHPVTDHNFYAICGGLLVSDPLSPELPKGLLHSVPEEIANSPKYEKFSEYLESCRVPGPKLNRIEAARGLKNLLGEYLGIVAA